MIDSSTLIRWKALADKSLDEGSPEPERIASMRALAKEVAKIDLSLEEVADTVPSSPEPGYTWQETSEGFHYGPHHFDPHRCGACNHDADSHTAHVRNGTCFECTVAGRTCTRTRNEILGKRAENEPRFGRPTRARR